MPPSEGWRGVWGGGRGGAVRDTNNNNDRNASSPQQVSVCLYLCFTEEVLLLQRTQVDLKETDQILMGTQVQLSVSKYYYQSQKY